MPLDTLGNGTVALERVYQAAIEDVWALWTTPEGLEAWFAPAGMHVEVTVLEPWVGGVFHHVMTATGTEQIAYLKRLGRPASVEVSGRFLEVVLHRRLLIRFDIDFVPGVPSYPYDMLVEFDQQGTDIRMTLTADRHPDPEMTRGAIAGLTSQLQRFDLALAARSAKE